MCVAFWSLEHPNYALILCSNRDEYLSRPTSNAHFHSFDSSDSDRLDDGSVLSGRDILAGGTWAGINRKGRVAILTNITEPPKKYSSSRGTLTSSFLLPKTPSATFRSEVEAIVAQPAKFAGFNLLLLSVRPAETEGEQTLTLDAAFVTNSGGGGPITARELSDEERRCGGMSNGIDRQGASEWPKVKHGTRAMQEVLDSVPEDVDEGELAERLFNLLAWKSDPAPVDRSTLRNTIQVEPLAVQLTHSSERSIQEFYGTRLSTIILMHRDGNVLFIERDIWMSSSDGGVPKTDAKSERVFRFCIDQR
ncbi:DUF833-domain-containing protein [Wolfiporia cocos MD-104 SS10]|uniref:DUF833-domain-containing protein n=1 Tax=Wolfiporia cocos (strain MD-104) TaxID=742152 RepID=A0A2H3JUK1_WOLCO|nr:DUF833-domain-containing protein [Wolfiporia cocos MD-104 SS10]